MKEKLFPGYKAERNAARGIALYNAGPMKTADFDYHLPDELIARYPAAERTKSRLLVMNRAGHIDHRHFSGLPTLLRPGDLLVLNNTRVMPARLYGRKATGGQLELLVERIESEEVALLHIGSNHTPKTGANLLLFADENCQQPTAFTANLLGREGSLFRVQFSAPVMTILESIGHIPLPPYIDRADEKLDVERYQTVYASLPGAVAAPTAGLHFDGEMMDLLKARGVEFAEVTLHVGAGTFQPVKVEDLREHTMHSEWIEVSAEACAKVQNARAEGRRVVAVGTTSVRALESASHTGKIQPFSGDTRIFIYPGYRFRSVDALITNFHLPKSTLLMLVSAFAGVEEVRHAYHEAVGLQYRFFSYGDAMFLERKSEE